MNEEEVPQENMPDSAPTEEEVPQESLPAGISAQAGDEVPSEALPAELNPATQGTGNRILGDLEALGRGATGGMSDVAASKMQDSGSLMGLPMAPPVANIEARKEARPLETEAFKIAGNIALFRLMPRIAARNLMAEIGANAIKDGIAMSVVQGGDDYSKAMLGDPTYAPDAVAANMAWTGGIGALLSAGLGTAGAGASLVSKWASKTNLGSKIKSFISGFGHAITFPEEAAEKPLKDSVAEGIRTSDQFKDTDVGGSFYEKQFKWGQKAALKAAPVVMKTVQGAAAKKMLPEQYKEQLNNLPGGNLIADYAIGSLLAPALSNVSKKYVGPMILKMVSTGTADSIADTIDHGVAVSKGAKYIDNTVNSLFKPGAIEGIKEIRDQQRKNLKDFQEDGGMANKINEEKTEAQNFAEGGLVIEKQHPVGVNWPEQNIMLNAAKTRISGYLNTLRPTEGMPMGPIYDREQKDPEKEKSYNKAIDLAISPMTIFNKIKKGTLLPQDMAHFKAMYPELHDHLSKKITERMLKGKMEEETKPPYHVRQALSLFLGTNLDSTLSQPNIMAAQAVFINKKAQQQAPVKTNGLNKIAKTAQTPGQARDQALTRT